MPASNTAFALCPWKETRTCPCFCRNRKSGSASRIEKVALEELYGHIKVTTALIDFVDGSKICGESWLIGIDAVMLMVSAIVATSVVVFWIYLCAYSSVVN
jgi:hypothetical protein